jgi:outer membrane receptor protein involved in Fe transport
VPYRSQGFFVFANLAALHTAILTSFVQSFGNFDTNMSETRFASFVQDHWNASSALTVDFGMRYEYNQLPSSFPQDALNFSPRFRLAWTPF